jgi:hypothetical protein
MMGLAPSEMTKTVSGVSSIGNMEFEMSNFDDFTVSDLEMAGMVDEADADGGEHHPHVEGAASGPSTVTTSGETAAGDMPMELSTFVDALDADDSCFRSDGSHRPSSAAKDAPDGLDGGDSLMPTPRPQSAASQHCELGGELGGRLRPGGVPRLFPLQQGVLSEGGSLTVAPTPSVGDALSSHHAALLLQPGSAHAADASLYPSISAAAALDLRVAGTGHGGAHHRERAHDDANAHDGARSASIARRATADSTDGTAGISRADSIDTRMLSGSRADRASSEVRPERRPSRRPCTRTRPRTQPRTRLRARPRRPPPPRLWTRP